MDKLSAPSPELIARIQHEVDFNDRLMGSTVHERAGIKAISLYSLYELFMLLHNPYPQIDLQRLEQWIRTVIKDEELAERIKTVFCLPDSDLEKLLHIRNLVGERLMQCSQQQG